MEMSWPWIHGNFAGDIWSQIATSHVWSDLAKHLLILSLYKEAEFQVKCQPWTFLLRCSEMIPFSENAMVKKKNPVCCLQKSCLPHCFHKLCANATSRKLMVFSADAAALQFVRRFWQKGRFKLRTSERAYPMPATSCFPSGGTAVCQPSFSLSFPTVCQLPIS